MNVNGDLFWMSVLNYALIMFVHDEHTSDDSFLSKTSSAIDRWRIGSSAWGFSSAKIHCVTLFGSTATTTRYYFILVSSRSVQLHSSPVSEILKRALAQCQRPQRLPRLRSPRRFHAKGGQQKYNMSAGRGQLGLRPRPPFCVKFTGSSEAGTVEARNTGKRNACFQVLTRHSFRFIAKCSQM